MERGMGTRSVPIEGCVCEAHAKCPHRGPKDNRWGVRVEYEMIFIEYLVVLYKVLCRIPSHLLWRGVWVCEACEVSPLRGVFVKHTRSVPTKFGVNTYCLL